jgi:hypothetical protein
MLATSAEVDIPASLDVDGVFARALGLGVRTRLGSMGLPAPQERYAAHQENPEADRRGNVFALGDGLIQGKPKGTDARNCGDSF